MIEIRVFASMPPLDRCASSGHRCACKCISAEENHLHGPKNCVNTLFKGNRDTREKRYRSALHRPRVVRICTQDVHLLGSKQNCESQEGGQNPPIANGKTTLI